jgi:hypothetical protein
MLPNWMKKQWFVLETLNGRKEIRSKHWLEWSARNYVVDIVAIGSPISTRNPHYEVISRKEWEEQAD